MSDSAKASSDAASKAAGPTEAEPEAKVSSNPVKSTTKVPKGGNEKKSAAETAAEKIKKAMPEDDSDPRPHMNAVFIGHVDAGKSTLCGSILFHTGQVDDRTIAKFQKEA